MHSIQTTKITLYRVYLYVGDCTLNFKYVHFFGPINHKATRKHWSILAMHVYIFILNSELKKVSEYDQEIQKSHTAAVRKSPQNSNRTSGWQIKQSNKLSKMIAKLEKTQSYA